jgi:hypothetical protein
MEEVKKSIVRSRYLYQKDKFPLLPSIKLNIFGTFLTVFCAPEKIRDHFVTIRDYDESGYFAISEI